MRYIITILIFFLISCNHDTGHFRVVSLGFNEKELMTIYSEAKLWQSGCSKIEFEFVDNDANVKIIKSDTLGYSGGLTDIETKTIILSDPTMRCCLHELGHILGLEHEFQRVDRDLYVHVDISGLSKEDAIQFIYLKSDLYDMTELPYDYKSIMHYKSDDYDEGVLTSDHEIGGDMITLSDLEKVNRIYDKKQYE